MRFTKRSGIGTLFDEAAERRPEATVRACGPSPVLDGADPLLTYDRLATIVRELSGWFPAAGVGPGDAVLIAKSNHLDVLLLAAAASRAGAVPTLVSGTVPAPEARVILDRVRPTAVVTDQAVRHDWALTPSEPWGLVVLDPHVDRADTPGVLTLDDLRGSPASPTRTPAYDAPMVVTHTSGTTGVPKLVAHSAATVAARARVVTWPLPRLSVRRRDRYAAYLPWNHARAIELITSTLHIGNPLLALADPAAGSLPPTLAPFRPTVLESVPNVFLLWEHVATTSRDLLAHLRIYLNAFDAMHPRTVRTFLDAAPRRALWVQGYGQSEVGCATVDVYTRRAVRHRPERPSTLRSMGWASPPMSRIRVTDPDTGARLGRRSVGQLEVRTTGRVLTYVGQEDLHARRTRGRWWTTGDIGYLTRTGRTFLHDRHVDHVAGLTSCLEIEDVLLDALPEATEVAILQLGDEAVPVLCTIGDRPLAPGRWAAATRSLTWALAPPLHLPWDTVPRTSTYKVRRHVLTDRLADGSITRTVAA